MKRMKCWDNLTCARQQVDQCCCWAQKYMSPAIWHDKTTCTFACCRKSILIICTQCFLCKTQENIINDTKNILPNSWWRMHQCFCKCHLVPKIVQATWVHNEIFKTIKRWRTVLITWDVATIDSFVSDLDSSNISTGTLKHLEHSRRRFHILWPSLAAKPYLYNIIIRSCFGSFNPPRNIEPMSLHVERISKCFFELRPWMHSTHILS